MLLKWLFFLIFVLPMASFAQAKFKRALVISGGGITPGFALGIIAGAQAAGYKPDLIIATCGASLGSSLAYAYPNLTEARHQLLSQEFYQILTQNVSIDTRFVFPILNKLEKAETNPRQMPYLFRETILYAPEKLPSFLPNDQFRASKNQPRLVILAARASFFPNQIDPVIYGEPSFRQVYFTDSDTAKRLRNFSSPVQKLFPQSRIEKRTEVITNVSVTEATRASIADPILINPAKIADSYYFSGAIDLYPVEMATALANEVLITYPSGVYSRESDLTISSTFGFSQTQRSIFAARATNVRWIDTNGLKRNSFDPAPKGIFLVNNIPASYGEFQDKVYEQYLLGYNRAIEAVRLRPGVKDVRTHLRSQLPYSLD